MFKIEVESSFSSAHYLRDYQGKCESLHGHNWRVRVTVEGKKLKGNGLLLDFGELKQNLKIVLEELDHKNLNEISYFRKNNPTSENIAKFIFGCLKNRLRSQNHRLKKVTVWENETSSATYSV
ncbi:MAG: 6-carboxytetrahydropterin synthase QueD [Candidatus Omnitrophica bacterium]|nr:6-carboxytetrahydropterin synthase QueD [Candidatus Omnitrophota bacterium]